MKFLKYREEFKVVILSKKLSFPIKLDKRDNDLGLFISNSDDISAETKIKQRNSIKDKIKELAYALHGTFESKQKVIDDFNIRYPECSKKSIDKKIKDLFVKEKRLIDPKARWYATESTLIEWNLD